MSHSYCVSPNLVMSEVGYCIDKHLKWVKTKEPIFVEIISKSEDLVTISTDICKAENDIFYKCNLQNVAYSIIFGPSEYNKSRLCIIKGLWRNDVGSKSISTLS